MSTEFAIHSELTMVDMAHIANYLERSIEKGGWKMEDIEKMTELYKKLDTLINNFNENKE